MAGWFGGARARRGDGQGAREGAQAFGEPAWWHVMGYESGPPGTLIQVEQRFRRLASLAHPDRGGSAERMQQLIRARAQARLQLRP